jgi:hypothetical protein
LEIKEKIKKTMKNRIFTEEHKNNLVKNHASTKYRKGKTFEEMYGEDIAEEYKNKLKDARSKYKTEKERLGEKYENIISKISLKLRGENNPMKKNKYLWYHNPNSKITIRIIEGCEVPEGYIKGRK